ncbi:hypothetical protein BF49_2940 [Bradyrhizobium sp.]|nr:hypothetical protein BF49_2940 [Bradyrhizobium sp.]
MIGSANADALPVPEIWQASNVAAVRRCRNRVGATRFAHGVVNGPGGVPDSRGRLRR